MRKLSLLNISAALSCILLAGELSAKVENQGHSKTSLQEALTSAYNTNSGLKAKLHGQYATHEGVSQAVSAFGPKLNAQGSLGTTETKSQSPPLFTKNTRNTDPRTYGISVSQPIFAGGQNWARYNSAEAAAEAGQFDLMNTEQQTLLSAVNAYVTVIFLRTSLGYREDNVIFLKENLKGIKAQVEVGEKTPTETAAAESQLAQGVAALEKNRGDLANAEANYMNVIGIAAGDLEYPSNTEDVPKTKDEILEIALKNNPQIINAELLAKKAGFDIDAATGALLPSVNLQGSAQKALNQSINKDKTTQLSAALQLSVPIYQSGAEYSRVRQQTEAKIAASYQLEQTRKSVREGAIKAYDDNMSAREQTISLKKVVESAKIARDGAVLEVDVGERSYLDLLVFQQRLIDAEIAYAQAVASEVLSRYQSLAITGRLTAQDMGLPVKLYDVKGHLDDTRFKLFGFSTSQDMVDGTNEQDTNKAG